MNFAEIAKILEHVVPIIIGLAFPLLIFFSWLSHKSRKRKLELVRSEELPVIGSEEDLRRAEEEAAKSPLNPREALLEHHVLHARFQTTRGYSETYMSDLVYAMEKQGIHCTYLFQETLPYGSVFHRHGIFELYVPRDQVEEAERFLRNWKA
jgi:hypothetical protein